MHVNIVLFHSSKELNFLLFISFAVDVKHCGRQKVKCKKGLLFSELGPVL